MLPKYSELVMASGAYKLLEKDAACNSVSHAYLLISPDTVALDVLTKLFIARTFTPDVYSKEANGVFDGTKADIIILPESGDKVLTKDVDFISETALYTPTASEYKYYVIRYGETMNESAQNKLLKTLEEPPPSVRIIIEAATESAVLPTVLSRCRKVELRPFSETDIEAVLKKEYPDRADAVALAAAASGGSITAAEKTLSSAYFETLHALALETLRDMKKSSGILPYAARYIADKDRLNEIVGYLELILRDLMAISSGAPECALQRNGELAALSRDYPPEVCASLMPVIAHAKKRLQLNGNVVGTIDELLFSILEVKAKCRKS